MSEEILKALTQLFAIITKQDGGVTANERNFVIRFFQQELDHDSVNEYIELYDNFSGYNQAEQEKAGRAKLTSVKDSVKTLGICRKINKTLTQKQKAVVLIKLLEMIGSDRNFTAQRMEIINTVSDVFNIDPIEYKLIEAFVIATGSTQLDFPNILVVNNLGSGTGLQKHIHAHLEGNVVFMRLPSVNMYFVKYDGAESCMLNGFIMQVNRVYLFSHGSTIKTQNGHALYYGDIAADFNDELKTTRLSLNANITEYRFQNGAIGLHDVVLAEGAGKLIGIMGASGAGKTTLLNVLAGLERPSKGEIILNGIDIHREKDKIQGAIGYVAQDDLLIEELTVFENLYYSAKLCFSSISEEDLNKRVLKTLESLGLDQRKDLRVGSALEKTISGGQRKRLNIALELIREPSVLYLDEPTSGLSSRDSENVIDLLKELSLKGKLIFVVIHQPSSDIYKMFDKMIIMDTGGYPAYNGNPVDAVRYFKKATHQVDSNRGQCEVCGNVNPEQIFNIIEARVVDEYGQATSKRKVSPVQWNDMYRQQTNIVRLEDLKDVATQQLDLPNKIKQSLIFAKRDLKAKISNKQYLLINLIEAPLLGFLLAFIIRYKSAPGATGYSFRFNENFPAYILMSIVVSLFMGLTVSAEEIIKDRKLLKRESFLNLSWLSYLTSKVGILFGLSAIQTFTFVIVGNLILGVEGMNFAFWLVLFSTSCMANVLGLNISSAFKSAVTVYVLIPLLLIPQMVLSGLIFSFDKLNDLIGNKGKVPVIADMMTSRWAYEAMATYQFINNEYEQPFFEYEKGRSMADFRATYLAEELAKRNEFLSANFSNLEKSATEQVSLTLLSIAGVLKDEPLLDEPAYSALKADLQAAKYSKATSELLTRFIGEFKKKYQALYSKFNGLLDKKMAYYEANGWSINENKNRYYNERLADIVMNVNTTDRIVEYKNELYQQIDPVFQVHKPGNALDYRAPFFIGSKKIFGLELSTFTFNTIVIWMMSAVLFIVLYFEVLRRIVNASGKPKKPKTTKV
jgi:ABC transport system ATP-binding/permease protein